MVSFPCLLRALVLKMMAKELFSGKDFLDFERINKHKHFKFSIDYEYFSIHFLWKIFDSTN